MKTDKETKLYIKKTLDEGSWSELENNVMEEIYKIGAYNGTFSEDSFGEDDRRNSVYAFLDTLVSLIRD